MFLGFLLLCSALSICIFKIYIYILKFLTNYYIFFNLGALSEKDVIEYFALNEISNRLCTVQQTSALTGEGIERALDNMISFRKHLERMKAWNKTWANHLLSFKRVPVEIWNYLDMIGMTSFEIWMRFFLYQRSFCVTGSVRKWHHKLYVVVHVDQQMVLWFLRCRIWSFIDSDGVLHACDISWKQYKMRCRSYLNFDGFVCACNIRSYLNFMVLYVLAISGPALTLMEVYLLAPYLAKTIGNVQVSIWNISAL